MSKSRLKKGDRVIAVDVACTSVPEGATGTLTRVYGEFVDIVWDDWSTIEDEGWYAARFKKVATEKKKPARKQDYKGNGKHTWETTVEHENGDTDRLRVPGGWLYRDHNSLAMTFVPLPEVDKRPI